MRAFLVSATAGIGLVACGSVAPPAVPPDLEVTPPPIDEAAKYAEHVAVRDIALPPGETRQRITDGGLIVANMEETENIKKPVDIAYLSGEWPDVGAVRRLEFDDGHYTLERVVENDWPERFRYQVWGLTSKAGRNVDYAVGEQAFEPGPDGGTRLTWTYRVKPNAAFKRPFVQRFVSNDLAPLMEGALDRTKVQLEAR